MLNILQKVSRLVMELLYEKCILRNNLRQRWNQIKLLNKWELKETILSWALHVRTKHGFHDWPRTFVKVVYNCEFRISRQYLRDILVLCIGNGIPLTCPGELVLIRVALSKRKNKNKHVQEMIERILLVLMQTRKPGSRVFYYDIKMKRTLMIEDVKQNDN